MLIREMKVLKWSEYYFELKEFSHVLAPLRASIQRN